MSFKTHLKAFLIVVIVGFVLGGGVYYYMNRLSSQGPTVGDNFSQLKKEGVPALELVDLDGRKVTSEELKNKVVILNFWASWCGPCVEEVPSLIKLIEHFKGEIVLLAISGDSSREDIDVFLKSFPGMKNDSIYVVFDQDRSIMKKFSVARLPESLILTKGWKAERKLAGSIDWFTEDAKQYMQSLLQ